MRTILNNKQKENPMNDIPKEYKASSIIDDVLNNLIKDMEKEDKPTFKSINPKWDYSLHGL